MFCLTLHNTLIVTAFVVAAAVIYAASHAVMNTVIIGYYIMRRHYAAIIIIACIHYAIATNLLTFTMPLHIVGLHRRRATWCHSYYMLSSFITAGVYVVYRRLPYMAIIITHSFRAYTCRCQEATPPPQSRITPLLRFESISFVIIRHAQPFTICRRCCFMSLPLFIITITPLFSYVMPPYMLPYNTYIACLLASGA